MMIRDAILNTYRGIAYTRCDDTGKAKYFSHNDFQGLNREPYNFKSSMGHNLSGNFYYYDGYDSDRLIVFDHGFFGGHRSYMKEIEMLCSHGYRVFAYDHTGCMESGGENPNGLAQSLHDLNDCLNTLKADERFGNLDFSVMGHSWGGFSCLNITALHPDISHVVVLSGFTSVERLVDSFFEGVLKKYRKDVMELERNANPDFVSFDAVETLSNTKSEVLLIYSDDDKMVRKSHFDILKEKLDCKDNIKFILENNKGHNPNYTCDAVNYLAEYSVASRKNIKSDEKKKAFVDSFDWNRMTAQDEKVWKQIFDFLDK